MEKEMCYDCQGLGTISDIGPVNGKLAFRTIECPECKGTGEVDGMTEEECYQSALTTQHMIKRFNAFVGARQRGLAANKRRKRALDKVIFQQVAKELKGARK